MESHEESQPSCLRKSSRSHIHIKVVKPAERICFSPIPEATIETECQTTTNKLHIDTSKPMCLNKKGFTNMLKYLQDTARLRSKKQSYVKPITELKIVSTSQNECTIRNEHVSQKYQIKESPKSKQPPINCFKFPDIFKTRTPSNGIRVSMFNPTRYHKVPRFKLFVKDKADISINTIEQLCVCSSRNRDKQLNTTDACFQTESINISSLNQTDHINESSIPMIMKKSLISRNILNRANTNSFLATNRLSPKRSILSTSICFTKPAKNKPLNSVIYSSKVYPNLLVSPAVNGSKLYQI